MRKVISTLVLFCVLIFTNTNLFGQDTEPNNSNVSSNQVPINSIAYGSVDNATDIVDWFKVTLTEPGQINVSININPTVDVSLSLIGQNGVTVLQQANMNGSGGSEALSVTGLIPGTYYVKIDAITGSGNYAMPIDFITSVLTTTINASAVVGDAPLNVLFSSVTNANIMAWDWDFNGDGITDSNTSYPQYMYNTPGIYNVRLVVYTDDARQDTAFQTITVNTPPVYNYVLDDFEVADYTTNLQANWITFNDNTAGGLSTISSTYVAGPSSVGAISASFSLTQGALGYDPYVGFMVPLTPKNKTINLTNSTGVSFYYKGEACAFQIQTSTVGDYGYHQVSLPATPIWTLYTFNWGDFVQPTWASQVPLDLYYAQAIGFNIQGPEGISGSVAVDDITILGYHYIPVQQIDLSTISFTLEKLSSNYLNYYITPSNASFQGVSFASLDTALVSIDSYGNFFCKQVGTANIKVYSDIDTTIEAIATVTITPIQVRADFGVSQNIGYNPMNVSFYTYSIGENLTYEWDFNNDGLIDDTNPNPIYIFNAPGNYSVKLKVTDSNSVSDSIVRVDFIKVGNLGELIPDFTAAYLTGQAPFSNYFYDNSVGAGITTWEWDFNNDGTIESTDQNPTYTYDTPGIYSVKLTITGGDLIPYSYVKNNYITVTPSPIYASFSTDVYMGYSPLLVNFFDNSSPTVTAWEWDFDNDGTIESTIKNPSYTFTTPGYHAVKLTVYDAYGQQNSNVSDYAVSVSIPNPPSAYFYTSNSNGYAPLIVNFMDMSNGTNLTYEWDFNGDGIIESTVQNPTFTFTTAGSFNVVLKVTDIYGQISTYNSYVYTQEDNRIKYCDVHTQAQLGNNFADFASSSINENGRYVKWYSYTATSNCRVKVDVCGSEYTGWAEVYDVFNDCNYTSMYQNIKMLNCSGGKMSSMITVNAGQKIYFSIASDGPMSGFTGINFVLSEVPIVQGDICSWPLIAQLGSNSANTANGDSWSRYIAQADGYLEISTCGTTDKNTSLEVYRSNCSYLFNSADNNCGIQEKMFFHVAMYDTILVSWKDYNYKGQFNWKLTYFDNDDLYVDFNATPQMGVDSALINFNAFALNASLLNWDFNNDGMSDAVGENPTWAFMLPGYYPVSLKATHTDGVQTQTVTKQDFIIVQTSNVGNVCETASPATIGSNTLSFINGQQQWFSYTVDFTGKLLIDLCSSSYPGYANVYTVQNDCNGPQLYGQNTYCNSKNSVLINVTPGMKIKFQISTGGYIAGVKELQFNLVKILPQPGDMCSLPLQIQNNGIYQIVPDQYGSGNYRNVFYEYTAPRDGVLELNNCINGDRGYLSFNVLKDCENNDNSYMNYNYKPCSASSTQGYIAEVKLIANQKVIISVNAQLFNSAQWQLTFRDYYPGEICAKPLLAKVGSNLIPSAFNEVFYTYTAPGNGLVSLSSCQYFANLAAGGTTVSDGSAVMVQAGCNETDAILTYAMQNCGQGTETAFEVVSGQTYIIKWYSIPGSTWNLEFIQNAILPQGYSCNNPFPLALGETTVPPSGNFSWFEFTMPQTGTYAMSSDMRNEASLFIMEQCMPITEDLTSQLPYVMTDTALMFWPQAGKTYKMLIVFKEEAPTMPYTIKTQYISSQPMPSNVICSDAQLITTTGLKSTTTKYGSYWYQYNAKANTILHLDIDYDMLSEMGASIQMYYKCPSPFDGGGDGYYNNIYTNCGSNLQGIARSIDKDTTIYIQVRTNDTTATVNWALYEYNTSAAGINTFSLYNQVSPAVINNTTNTVNVTISKTSDLTYISPSFELFVGSQMMDINNYPICSNSQLFVNAGQVQVKIKSFDGTVSENWTINVTQSATFSSLADITMLASNTVSNVQINTVAKTVSADLEWYTPSCFNINPQMSAGATSPNMITGLCYAQQDTTVQMTVLAEDGVATKNWTIALHRLPKPAGVVCANPKTAELGYNNLRYDNTQSTVWMRYVVKNDGLLKVESCYSYDPITLNLMSDCASDLPANYTSCNGSSMSKAEINVVKNQVVYISAMRGDSSYSNNTDLYITEIPDIVTYFSVSPNDISVFLNDTINLSMIVYPSMALMQNISASISTGALTPMSITKFKATQVGNAVITFTTTDGSNKTQTVNVLVKPLPILVNNIVIPTAYSVIPGQTSNIPAIITPLTADNKGVTWVSSNPNVATVDQTGMLYAKTVGTTTINAYSMDGSNKVSNNCVVTVNPVAAESIIVNKSSVQIPLNGIYSGIVATVLPINATDVNLVWTSNNPAIVSIVNNELYGFSLGTTTIKIALQSNPLIFANVAVTVTNTVILDKSELDYKIQQAENTINAIISQGLVGSNTGQYPAINLTAAQTVIADAKTVQTSATTQAQINQAITDLQTAIINLEQSRIDQIQIAYLNIKRDTIYAFVNETKQVTPEILPTNATFINLNWYSNNSSIASVNANGLISALGVGQTYVKAATKDGSNKIDSVLVIVSSQLMGIYLTQSASILEGTSKKLEPITYPMDAPIEGFTWISDDESVATVDAYGNVSGISNGIAIISVIETKSGKTASCVLYVESQAVPVTSIAVDVDTIHLVLGANEMLYPYVLPYNATNQQYTLTVDNSNILINSTGLITAFNIGESTITITSVDGGFTSTVIVQVEPSAPPVVSEVAPVMIQSGTSEVEVDLTNYISDDNTPIDNIQIQVVNNPNYTVTVINNTIVIEPVSPSVPSVGEITVIIIDQDNLETELVIPIEISVIPNIAPEFVVEEPEFKALDGTSFTDIDLTQLVSDDYTTSSDLQFEVTTPSENFITFINNGVLEVTRIDANWVGIDSIEVTVTDGAGLTTTQTIVLEVSQLPNEAPVLSSIPTQNYIQSTSRYPVLDLKRYVSDDYTTSSNIAWSFTPNPKLQITISRGVAMVYPADRNWNGSTTVTYFAYDQDGLSSSTTVEYVQTVGASASWLALPKISFTASQTVVGSGTPVTFTSSITGADSWIWEFEGLTLTPQQRIVPNPTVTYTKGGKYTVKLYAGNSHGDDSLVKVDYITVIGIDEVPANVCKGSTVTLTSTVPASSGYTFTWNTGATTESISPVLNTVGPVTYTLTVKKGWFTYEDQVTITVSDTLKLPNDVSFCSGSSYTLTVPGYSQYNWDNTGWVATNNKVLTQLGTTVLRVRDAAGCESQDDIAVSAVYPLPVVGLGADQVICEGTSATLTPVISSGTVPYDKLWSTTAITNTLVVNNDGDYSVEVTDANGCKDSDTVNVSVLRVHTEELGVATYAKEGNGVVLAWERSLGNRTASYEVERQTSVAGVYEVIATVPFNTTQSFVEDIDANVLTKSYKYRLVTIDSTCNNRAYSTPHQTVHVITDLNDLTNKVDLQWSKYEGLAIPTYKIMKGTSYTNLVEVDAVAGNAAPSWSDPLQYVSGNIYRIEMVLPDTVETRWALWKSESGPFTLALSNIAEVETGIESIDNSVLIYPTIATDFVTVEFENSIDDASIKLISASGEVVYVQDNISGSSTQIPVDKLSQGVYTIVVISGIKQITSSIIVQ